METPARILIVEDDKRLSALIGAYLSQRGYEIHVEERGDTAEQRVADCKPHLLILDLMLPGMDGLSICRAIRDSYRGPIMVLTAKTSDMDQVLCLEMGADDFVKKPVDPMVLLARIRSLLRRTETKDGERVETAGGSSVTCNSLSIDTASRAVFLCGNEVELTTGEYDLLLYLVQNPGTVITREALYSHLRGMEYDGVDRSVDVYISRLRKKLGDHSSPPARIKTVWGTGYLFVRDAW